MTKLEKVIHKTFTDCLKIKPNEALLIVVDGTTYLLGKEYFNKALGKKFEAALLEIGQIKNKLLGPASSISKIIQHSPVIFLLTSNFLIHSKLIKHACHNGARVLCVDFQSREVFERTVCTDFHFIQEKSKRIAELLSICRHVKLTTPAGTNLTFRIGRNKSVMNTGLVDEAGKYCFFPAGEAHIKPDRNSAEGVVIVDGSVPPLCLIDEPIRFNVKNGYGYKLSGGKEAEILRKKLKPFGKGSRNIAEFGIGTNPRAILTGESIEDEKVLGTVHLALGDIAYEGGSLKKNLHIDLVLKKPTVILDGHAILKNGRLMV